MKLSEQLELINKARKTAPVDLHMLAASLGVRVKLAFLADKVSGMIEKLGDTYLITLSAFDPPTRQRFTLAHELGHYIMHRHLIGDGLDDDRAYRSTDVGKYHNTAVGPREETQANKFAASLLMPDELIQQEWDRLSPDVDAMASHFGVSKHAMCIRLGLPY